VRAIIAIAVAVIAIAVTGLLALHYSAHKPAFVIVHKGQPMPRHYIQAWSFGNTTIVQVGPSTTTVTVAPISP